jgi:hypothetical protein
MVANTHTVVNPTKEEKEKEITINSSSKQNLK